MTGITKTLTFPATRGMSVQVTVTESWDLLSNSSSLTVAAAVLSDTYSGHIYYLNGSVSIDGTALCSMDAYAGSHSVYIQRLNAAYPIRGSGDTGSPWTLENVVHDESGAKTVAVRVTMDGQEASSKGADGWAVDSTQTLELTHIPRASSVSATDAAIGAVSMIAVGRKAMAYTHTVAYAFGELTGYLTADGHHSDTPVQLTQTSIGFRLPESFYGQIPGSPTGSCTLTCRTYAGTTPIGDAQSCSFTVTADAALCAPELTATAYDINETTLALTGDKNVLIRGQSNVLCTLEATAKNGASITGTVIGTQATTSRVVEGVQTNTFVFAAADSRGYGASVTVEKTMIPYVTLTCLASACRTEPTTGNAVLTLQGDFFADTFGLTENSLTLRCRLAGGDWQSMTPEIADGGYTASAYFTGLDYTRAYTVEVEASDALVTVTRTVTVGKGVPVFDWGEEDFTFHVPVRLEQGFSLSGSRPLADLFYPVGSVYISTASTSPATLFGGTWSRLRDRFLLAAGSVAAGATGGAAQVTLTESQLPVHSHRVPNIKITAADAGYAYAESWGGGSESRDLSTESAGAGQAHENMPPYLAVYMWERTA